MLAVSAMLTSSSAYVPASAVAPTRPTHTVRQRAVFMDETIMEKALAGELEQEGPENVFMSELGWATYLDKNAGSSYNMNERPSMAQDGYFTADIFSNPIDGAAAGSRGLEERGTAPCCSVRDLTRPFCLTVVGDWLGAVKRAVGAPLATSFMTISNDPNGARSFPKGYDEVKSRTIAPKVKDFNPKLRITGIPGYNLFGTPSSKQGEFLDK